MTDSLVYRFVWVLHVSKCYKWYALRHSLLSRRVIAAVALSVWVSYLKLTLRSHRPATRTIYDAREQSHAPHYRHPMDFYLRLWSNWYHIVMEIMSVSALIGWKYVEECWCQASLKDPRIRPCQRMKVEGLIINSRQLNDEIRSFEAGRFTYVIRPCSLRSSLGIFPWFQVNKSLAMLV